MGVCSSKKKTQIQQNEQQNPFFLELINTIFQQAVSASASSSTTSHLNSTQYKTRIQPYIKQLIDFLESNQIRIPDTVKEIYEKVKKSQDIILLNTGLYLLESLIESINKVFLNQQNLDNLDDEDYEQNESENKGLLNIHPIDSQVLQKLILIKSQILHVLLLFVEQKVGFIVHTFPLVLSILQSFAKFLMTINYDKKINYLIAILEDIIMKYIFPLISTQIINEDHRERTYALARHNITLAKNLVQEQKIKDELIDRIVNNLTEQQFLEIFDTYVMILKHVELQRTDFEVSTYLFKNENQSMIFSQLVWLFTNGKITFQNELSNSGEILGSLENYLKQLIDIYQTKALHLKVFDEFFNLIFLDFNSQLWVQDQKVFQLMSLLQGNEIFIIQKLINNLQNCLILYKNYISIPSQQQVNELTAKQFSHYLVNQQQQIKKCEQSTDFKSSYVQEKQSTEIEVIKTIVKCLEMFFQKIENPQIISFQFDEGITTLLKCVIIAHSSQSQTLLIQTKITLRVLLQHFDANQYFNALKLFIIFISEHQKIKNYKNIGEDEEKIEDIEEQQSTMQVTNLVLEVLMENLNLLDKLNQDFFIEDELVVSLYSIAEKEPFEQKMKIITILTRIIFQLDFDMSLSQSFFLSKKINQLIHISDDSLSLFLIKYYEQGITSIQNIFTLIQILKGIIYQDSKEFIVMSMAQWILSRLELNIDMILLACIELAFCEKYNLNKNILITQFLATDSIDNLKKATLNNLINFSKLNNTALNQHFIEWFKSQNNFSSINFEEAIGNYKKKIENLEKFQDQNNIHLVDIDDVQIKDQRQQSSYTSQNYYSNRSFNRIIDYEDFDNVLKSMQITRIQRKQYNSSEKVDKFKDL